MTTARRPPLVTAYQLDEIKRCYGNEPTSKLAKRLGLVHATVNSIARTEGVRMTKRQRSLAISPYWKATA